MLVLSRKVGEKVRIGDQVVLTVLEVVGNRVRLGIDAPRAVQIVRQELDREPRADCIRPNLVIENVH